MSLKKYLKQRAYVLIPTALCSQVLTAHPEAKLPIISHHAELESLGVIFNTKINTCNQSDRPDGRVDKILHSTKSFVILKKTVVYL